MYYLEENREGRRRKWGEEDEQLIRKDSALNCMSDHFGKLQILLTLITKTVVWCFHKKLVQAPMHTDIFWE